MNATRFGVVIGQDDSTMMVFNDSGCENITRAQFILLCQVAANHLDRPPANVMKFLDIVIHGKPQQDYQNMDVYKDKSNVGEPRSDNTVYTTVA